MEQQGLAILSPRALRQHLPTTTLETEKFPFVSSACSRCLQSVARILIWKFSAVLRVGFGERGLLEKGSFEKSPFLEIRANLEILEILETPTPDCGKGESDHFLETLDREFRDFGDSRDSSSEKTRFVMTPFSGPERVPPRNYFTASKMLSGNSKWEIVLYFQ